MNYKVIIINQINIIKIRCIHSYKYKHILNRLINNNNIVMCISHVIYLIQYYNVVLILIFIHYDNGYICFVLYLSFCFIYLIFNSLYMLDTVFLLSYILFLFNIYLYYCLSFISKLILIQSVIYIPLKLIYINSNALLTAVFILSDSYNVDFLLYSKWLHTLYIDYINDGFIYLINSLYFYWSFIISLS